MLFDWLGWGTPWGFYFNGYLWLPFLLRLALLGGPLTALLLRHGPHLRWLWQRLLELPRGRTIALNLLLGLTVPLLVGISIRLTLGPFGKGWAEAPLWATLGYLGLLGVHFIWDLRGVWRGRNLVKKAMHYNVGRYRSYYEKLSGLRQRFSRWTHPEQKAATPAGSFLLRAGKLAVTGLFPAVGLLEKAMVLPLKASRRWMYLSLLEGLVFHLSPLALLVLFF